MKTFHLSNSSILIALAIFPLLTSCIQKAKPPSSATASDKAEWTLFTYKAVSMKEGGGLPSKVYVFPPLRSNEKAVPIEKLVPVKNSEGVTTDWRTSSEKSNRLRKFIESQLSTDGFQIITFDELLKVNAPYSVLVVSSFYSNPSVVEKKGESEEKSACLVMMKGSTFGVDLDPAKKRDLVKVDGLSRYVTRLALPDPVESSMREAFSRLGENAQGYTYLY